MKIDKNYFRVFFLILCSVMFIFGIGKLGTFTYEKVFAEDTLFPEGTYIGPVSVEGLTVEKAQNKLRTEVTNYQSTAELSLSYSDEKVTIPIERIQFYIEESILGAVNGAQNVLLAEVHAKNLHEWVSQMIPEDLVESVHVERLKEELEATVGLFKSGEVSFPLYQFIKGEEEVSQVLSQASISTGVIDELSEGVTVLIEPYSTFSFLNDFASQYPTWSDERLTRIASALYQVSLETNLHVIERQISNEQPLGIPLGFEAKIKRNSIDFVLKNPNDFPLEFQFQSNGNGVLTVKVSGFPLSKKCEVVLSEPVSHPYRQIVQYSPYLQRGQETVKVQGINGASITVRRNVYDDSGERIKREGISEDFYLPVHQIITKSVLAEVEEEAPEEDISIEQDETEIENEVEEKDQEETKAEENIEQEEVKIPETEEV